MSVSARLRRVDRIFLGLLAVTVVGLIARLAFLGGRIAHWDEGRVGYDILRYAATGAWEFRPIVHGPFLPHVNRVVFELLGASDFTSRLVVAIVGALLPLTAWLYRLMQFGRARGLTTATAEDLKTDIQAMHSGEHPTVQDDGIQKSTLRSYQAALRKFYGYHEEYDVAPEDIPMFSQDDSHVDPPDMLTKEEIQEAREAAGNPRDRLLFELLLNTGQRRKAIRTLRLKDVDVEAGTYRLNPELTA